MYKILHFLQKKKKITNNQLKKIGMLLTKIKFGEKKMHKIKIRQIFKDKQ